MTRLSLGAALALASAPLAAALLGGCGTTSSSFSCQNADCEVTLNGAGSDAELDALGVTIQLAGVDDETATLEVLQEGGGVDEEVTLAEEERAEVAGVEVVCVAVAGDEVALTAGPG